jgi:hypothetical protein
MRIASYIPYIKYNKEAKRENKPGSPNHANAQADTTCPAGEHKRTRVKTGQYLFSNGYCPVQRQVLFCLEREQYLFRDRIREV